MNWLLWREYRRNRWILAGGAVVLLLPFLNALGADESEERLALFVGYSIFCSLTVAMLAGNAIAAERADRSAEFLDCLLLGRWRLLASKLFLSLIAITVIWGVYLLSLIAGMARFVDLGSFGITLLVTFAVSWLVSSLQSSAAFAVASGFAAPMLIFICMLVSKFHGIPQPFHAATSDDIAGLAVWYAMICLPVAVVCFSVGTLRFLRRGEP
jgi:ABC-type transport system involved in multi-copper enzyme maturation permease subunit